MGGMKVSPHEMNQMMHEAWHQEQLKFEEMQRIRQFENERIWKESELRQENKIMMKEWKNEFIGEQQKLAESQFQDAFKEAEIFAGNKVDEQVELQKAATDMIGTMMNDPDPRFQNSKFLAFLDKLKTVELKIEGNNLIYNPEMITTSKSGENNRKI